MENAKDRDESISDFKKLYEIKNPLPTFRQIKELLRVQAYKICCQYLFELNTSELRKNLVNSLDRLISPLAELGIIWQWQIICDESNNTMETIGNNELHVRYAIKENYGDIDFTVFDISIVPQKIISFEEI